jgi:hypothetical protein
MTSGHEILVRLLELTPEPSADATIEHVIATLEVILAAREEVIAQLAPPIQLTEADRPLLVELERRQLAWQDRLAAAQHTVGEHRLGAGQLRAYARRL